MKISRGSTDSGGPMPIDEGFLVASEKTEVVQTLTGPVGHIYIPVNSPASDYAIPMHEWSYNLGKGSLTKQAGQKEVVGRKYLERALTENIMLQPPRVGSRESRAGNDCDGDRQWRPCRPVGAQHPGVDDRLPWHRRHRGGDRSGRSGGWRRRSALYPGTVRMQQHHHGRSAHKVLLPPIPSAGNNC